MFSYFTLLIAALQTKSNPWNAKSAKWLLFWYSVLIMKTLSSILAIIAVFFLASGCHRLRDGTHGFTNQSDRNSFTRAIVADVKLGKLRWQLAHSTEAFDAMTDEAVKYQAIAPLFNEFNESDYDRPLESAVDIKRHIAEGLGANASLVIGDSKTEPTIVYSAQTN